MKRWLWVAGAALVVAAAVGLIALLRDGRPSAGGDVDRPSSATSSRRTAGGPLRPGGPPPIDASPLPSPADEAEARARVLADYQRPPHLDPGVLKTNQTVKPMREARDAYADGDYPHALERALDVLALEPDDRQARMYAVMAACAMGEAGVAQAHADKMEPGQKVRAARKCARHGLTLANVSDLPEE